MTVTKGRRFLPSLSLQVLAALALGLIVGAIAQSRGLPGGAETASFIGSLGQLWLNALKMTIVPLVFSLLVTGIASIAGAAHGPGRAGLLAGRALMVFAILIVVATVY
ncbi:MAG: cation:dicarboxylase symporter family transporter, partial [Brevundimonas sp.]|nr:cation:dicarboxylase symporter family transporter [Brevundimonas sp.]